MTPAKWTERCKEREPTDTPDFRDFGQQELKRDPGTAWERNQQTEYLPGVGRVR